MKTTFTVALTIIILGLAGLLIGPSFMDWNKYKPQIIEQAKKSSGYDIHIDGDIGLSILPAPRLKIQGLSVDAPKGKAEKLISVEDAFISVDLFSLMSGDIVVDTVRLEKPRVTLEKLADGTFSWAVDKNQQNGGVTPSDASSDAKTNRSISLGNVVIEEGALDYVDRQTGKTQELKDINIDLSAKTLEGPFSADGNLLYNGKRIDVDIETEQPKGDKKEFDAELEIGLPESNASASFKGVVALSPMEVQGKLNLEAKNLAEALSVSGQEPSPALARPLSFSGLVTASENEIRSEDISISYGDTKGTGNVVVSNFKDQNPVKLQANMGFKGVLNFDQIAPKADKSKQASVEEKVAKGQKLSSPAFLPESLSLPFPLEAKLKIVAEGIQMGGVVYKGVSADIVKTGSDIDFTAAMSDIPGKTNLDIRGLLRYATASRSGDKGITYADPKLTFAVNGTSQQFPTLLRSFAPDQDDNKALEIYKTARFDVQGMVGQDKISFNNSTVKLDDTTLALSGSYKPYGQSGRPDVMLDLTTDYVDIDHIQSRLNGQKKAAVQKDSTAAPDLKKSLEPVRGFEVPLNLNFDISAQKARFNAQDINGIRIKGFASGSALKLDVASAQDFMGAVASLKGRVDDLKTLSGVDLSFYGKTSNLKALMESLKMDTSKLPQSISSAEANISAKGKAEALNFDADIAALNGQLRASGDMTGLLDTPSFNNLVVGAKHPNLVKAIQVLNPAFSGSEGLEKPFDFQAKAVKDGNVYDLKGMKATLGSMSVTGDLKVDQSGAKPFISGNLQAGDMPLDSFLGAKNAGAGGSGGAAVSSSAGGGKWSKAPLETGWMHSMNADLNLAAKSITYGGWNFINPSTRIGLKDGTLNVDGLKAGLFGGNASMNARVVDPADEKQPLSLSVQSKMDNVNLEPLVTALSGTRRLKAAGDVSFDMDVSGSGLSSHALVSSLQGKSTLNGSNIVMKGFDLAQIGLAFVDSGKPLDRLSNLVGGATTSGETRFDTIKGNYDIAQGVVNISSMEMDGPAANIKSKGNANLPQWYIDTIHTITFKQAKDAGAFDVAIKGSLSSPANTFGKGLFNDVLTRRLQGKVQEKLQEKLPDVLGKDLTGKLQGLGILPSAPKPAPAPTPAPVDDGAVPAVDDSSQNAPVAPVPAPAPTPAPAPQTQQDDSKKALEDEASKAIQGVLNGLLQ